MSSPERSSRIISGLLTAVGLIVLGVQIAQHYFATDDAFISFRYARNLVEGNGLVFNIGERVEGYSNFLWTLWSGVGHLIGVEPTAWANSWSIILTGVLVGLVVYTIHRRVGTTEGWIAAAVAVVYLGVNRSFAVWATGGLETRLFTLLVFAAIITCPLFDSDRSRLKLSSGLFALAALTRMEAYLLFAVVTALALIMCGGFRNWRGRDYLHWLGPFGIVAAGHLLFRLVYYGYPLPNTAYAKITGANFAMGWKYLAAFAMEYHVWLLLPLILTGAFIRKVKAADGGCPWPIGAALLVFVPYLLYLAYIGGDHFEYRQLDILLPFVAVALGVGVARVAGQFRSQPMRFGVTGALVFLIVAATVLIPWIGGKSMPERYRVASVPTVTLAEYPWLRWIPGYGSYVWKYNELYKDLVMHLAAIRAEEHKFFLAKVTEQAEFINHYIDAGLIDRGQSLSLICIGAIPYYTRMTTIDYNGLTDEYVAHSKPSVEQNFGRRLIAHEKNADWEYLMERKVDYVFSIGWGFFTDQYPLPITQPRSYMIQLPERWMAFRTAMTEEEVRGRFGEYPIVMREANDLVRRVN